MLSQQTSAMDQSQRQHQRQNSTPIQLEASSIPHLPRTYPTANHYQMVPSLAHQMVPAQQSFGTEDAQVGITNTGHNSQHYLQATQQLGQARPGQQQQIQHHQPLPPQLSEEQFRNMQHRRLDAQLDTFIHTHIPTNTFPTVPPQTTFAPMPPSNMHFVKIERTRSNPEGYHGINTVGINPQNVMMSPSSGQLMYFDNPTECNSRRPSASSEMAAVPWSAPLQPNWSFQMQRPLTPPNQCSPGIIQFQKAKVDSMLTLCRLLSFHTCTNTLPC